MVQRGERSVVPNASFAAAQKAAGYPRDGVRQMER